MSKPGSGRGSLIGGTVAAIMASLCCIGPLVLVMLGVSGAWIGNLRILEPFRPLFLGVALLFLWLAYRRIFHTAVCAPGTLCAVPETNRRYRMLFWCIAALVGLALIFPYVAPFFY